MIEANLANPRTSEESKEHSRQVLDGMDGSGEISATDASAGKNEGNVIGGHKVRVS